MKRDDINAVDLSPADPGSADPGYWNRFHHVVTTRAMAELSRRRRAANVRGAFRIGRPLPERATVLLVDDVVTTARTVIEAALTLCESGVTRVVVAAAARTVRRSPDRDRR